MQYNNIICLHVIHTIIGITEKRNLAAVVLHFVAAVQEQFFKLNWSEKWASVVCESVGNQISFVPNKTRVWDLLPYPSEFFTPTPRF